MSASSGLVETAADISPHERAILSDVSAHFWEGQHLKFTVLSGGLTNKNFKGHIAEQDKDIVVRVPGAETELLGIDRNVEHENAKTASTTGIGALIEGFVEIRPDVFILVSEFVVGTTMSVEGMQSDAMVTACAKNIRTLHSSGPYARDFCPFTTCESYRQVVREKKCKTPDNLDEMIGKFERIGAQLRANPVPFVPCHNDLLPENWLLLSGADEPIRFKLVDFEYSGNSDPCFDIGNFCNESEYDDERIRKVCEIYFADDADVDVKQRTARVFLMMGFSSFLWTLWGCIQNSVSELDFDYWKWTAHKWERACQLVDRPEFEEWLSLCTK
eukprot:TRINITY_DN15230_c0_g1_i1.p1 TRINITY_DN15230_c0_g1~~TRINITY_DN15230_c0_g1_i1.p1  ORF type:complete len:376 (-),score=79.70 TRINITY_DN15230_c0_g1_i1:78-1067(-)